MDESSPAKITKAEWDEINSYAKWQNIEYDKLTPVDSSSIHEVLLFQRTAEFLDIEYKAKRGFSKWEGHNFKGTEGFRARVILRFRFKDKIIPVELRDSKIGAGDVFDSVRKEVLKTTWGKYWGGISGTFRQYCLTRANKDTDWWIFNDEYYRKKLIEPDELRKARVVISDYAARNKSVSKAFSNQLVKRIERSRNPANDLEYLIQLGQIVKEYGEWLTEDRLIEVIRFSYKFRNEFEFIDDVAKERIINEATVNKIHKE